MITRRQLLKTIGTASAGIALGGRLSAGEREGEDEKKMQRPNILFAIADDWSWMHASAYGCKTIKTSAFDRVAREGVLFTHAFCAAPTCTASRGSILTGQAPHRLEEGGNLWSTLPAKLAVYPDLLESAGYYVGLTGKGWGPGSVEAGGRKRNPAGPGFKSFERFLAQRPADKPFCYWFGSHRPHRAYEKGIGVKSGLKPEDVEVPPFLPDTPEVRSDILDYLHAVLQYEAEVSELLRVLDESGLAENTIVVVTSDNGMPFPRAKANLYDAGTRMPLAVRWPAQVKAGRVSDDLVSLTDFAPTFLEAAGVKIPGDTTGKSLLPILMEKADAPREAVFTERERHTDRREGKKSYPMRAIRTKDYLYVRNPRPHLWPAGDPRPNDPDGGFGDIDVGPTKTVVLDGASIAPFYELACAKRPEEELYDLKKDPWQLTNVAERAEYADAKRSMRSALDRWMRDTADPRAKGDDDRWDRYPYIRR